MEPFLGQISIMGFGFAPRDWAACNGQLMPISRNAALFSLLGTRFGGDGKVTFQLPDLGGRFPMGPGNSAQFNYSVGDESGSEEVTLTTEQMPAHTHSVMAAEGAASSASPQNKVPADVSGGVKAYAPPQGATGAMAQYSISPNGQGVPVNIMPPYLCLNFVIAINGIFPSRS